MTTTAEPVPDLVTIDDIRAAAERLRGDRDPDAARAVRRRRPVGS